MVKPTTLSKGIEAPCLILHVKKGYEARGKYAENMLGRLGIDFEFFLDGDVSDMNDDIRRKIFKGEMACSSPGVQSCSYKHLLAYHYILDKGWDGALILEDDISLRKDFCDIFNRSLNEYKSGCDPSRPTILSYDGSPLRFIPYSQRRKGQLLYPGPYDRCTGAFYINAAACRAFIDTAARDKIHIPVDKYHTYMMQLGILDYLWCEPAPAVQGSFNGTFPSSLTVRKKWLGKGRAQRAFVWWLKTCYRRLLYRLR
ncbi:MAG: glycosyltransferase family 25 protein [Muribaculaceae bacterium]|nr:glycosyltransferase family 25 protein [Muribaculaceae bacterium]